MSTPCCYGSHDCGKNNMGPCIHHQRDALQAFKDYVHKRLDDAGIPTHPNGYHSKAGCRIGDRLDIALLAGHTCEAQPPSAHECITDGSPCPCEPEVIVVEGERRG